jgi:tripartite-type tricarboxylate transporter receptor subunit TctC
MRSSMRRRSMIRVLLVGAVLLGTVTPAAAAYPERPVTAIVGYPAGGLADVVLRALVDGMKKKFPKGLAVVNRAGAGGSIGASEMAQAKPDGYTFGLVPLSTQVIHPQLNDLPYQTPDDYIPFINLVSWYPLVAVKADAPWKTPQEFLAAAKANPGKLRVGTPGEGTSSHLNLEELKRLADVNLTHVPFGGWAEGSPALLGGHIEAIVAQPGEVRPQVEAKRMRILGVFQPVRNPNFPDAPTWKEVGYPVHNGAWFLLIAPKGTAADIVKYLHDAAKAAIEEPAFISFAKVRVIDVDYRPGEKLRADLWQEYRQHTEILKRIGMLKK